MKRILTSSFIILTSYFALHGSAQADYLYFMTSAWTPTGWAEFDFARIGVAKVGGDVVQDVGGNNVYLELAVNDGGTFTPAGTELARAVDNRTVDPSWAVILGDYASSDYAFYIETVKVGDGGGFDVIWGYSADTATAYTSLVKQNHVYLNDTSLQTVTPWMAVPEPTSGMLALFGCALLALRRKRERQFRV